MTKRSSVTILLIIVLSVGLLFGLNAVTAERIAANGNLAELEPLFEVMSEASGFEPLYSSADPAASALAEVPESVLGIYKESGGMGYALSLSAVDGYTNETMYVTMGVDAEGRICGIKINTFSGTKELPADYEGTYIGQDSALGGVSLVAGVTYSSTAFKTAVTDGFNALIANGLVGAGVKGDSQLLMELLPSVYPGMANESGIAQFTEAQKTGTYIVSAMENTNECGMAYIVKDGESSYLAIVNLSGSCRVYDVEGKDVTDSVNSAIIDEVKSATELGTPGEEHNLKKLRSMLSDDAAEISPVAAEGVFNSVTNVYSIVSGGNTYTATVARPFGYGNINMFIYYIFDSNGAIVSMSSDGFIIEPDYFSSYTLDESSYKAGFAGLTKDSFTDDIALVSGATITSGAVKVATNDSFEAFDILMNGGENNA